MLQDKQHLRTIFKEKRKALTTQEVAEKSSQINHNFISNLLPKIYQKNSDQIFSLYISSYNEVSTEIISQHFFENKIKFSYPKFTQIDQPLEFILSKENQSFSANKFFPKILEPEDGNKIIPNIVILPLLAFDSSLSRLGMGGGFFDRTTELLKQDNSKTLIIGLAYDFQGSESPLPIEKTDQRLDFVVTESTIIS
jgi:5-formyltetrahydrofolate cyclo-ligase